MHDVTVSEHDPKTVGQIDMQYRPERLEEVVPRRLVLREASDERLALLRGEVLDAVAGGDRKTKSSDMGRQRLPGGARGGKG